MRRKVLSPLLFLLSLAITASAQTVADLAQKADAAYQAKRFAESASLYVQAIQQQIADHAEPSDRNGLEYNAACSFALAADKDNAFLWLSRAVENGSVDLKHTTTDTDLTSLHTDPRWQTVLTRMETISAAEKKHWSAAALNTPYTPNLSDAEKLAGLAELWAEARYGFANFWHVPSLDWDAAYLAFIPQVTATSSTADFYRVLQRFYALLQDGHTNVYPPEAIPFARLPIRTRLVDGHVLIVGVRDPAFDLQGVKVGDELLSINDQPVAAYAAQKVRPYVSASSPQDRDTRTYEYMLLSGAPGDILSLETAAPSGARSTHSFSIPKSTPSHTSAFAFRTLPNKIAYVALNSFRDDSAAIEFDKHYTEISAARALIVDLRENGGGNDSVGWHILSTLMDKPVPAPRSVSPRYVATYRAWGQLETSITFPAETLPPDPKRHFSGDVILLTSPRTFSAAEDMAVVFAQSNRGKIVGEPTGGSTGQPLSFALPGGGSARVCTKHDSFADGTEFVGIGVKPDLPAHLSAADIRQGKDSVLDRAVTLLTAPR